MRKNMKKKLFAILLAIVTASILLFCLVACENGSVASVSDAPEEAPAEEIPEVPITQGEATVDVGDFTVTVPNGWLGVGDYDVDENGKYFIEPYFYILVKGGEKAEDQHNKPTVTVYYCSDKDAQTLRENNILSIEKITDIDITVGGKKCPAYHSVMDFADEGEDPNLMEYDNVYIPVSDSSCIRVTMLTYSTADGETGANVSEEDVIAIMESLKVN